MVKQLADSNMTLENAVKKCSVVFLESESLRCARSTKSSAVLLK